MESKKHYQSCRWGLGRIREDGRAESDSEGLWQFSSMALGKKVDVEGGTELGVDETLKQVLRTMETES